MKSIVIYLIILSLFSCNHSENTPKTNVDLSYLNDTIIGMKGVETAKVISKKEFQYSKYHINISADPTGMGENIKVNNHEIQNEDAFYFFGIHDQYLFIDNGNSTNHRELIVYNLNTYKQVFRAFYESELYIKDGFIHYISPIDLTRVRLKKPIDCPENTSWSKKGLTIGYGAKCMFNLQTEQDSTTEEMICFPLQ